MAADPLRSAACSPKPRQPAALPRQAKAESSQQSPAGTWNGTPTSQTGVVCVPSG